MGLLKSASAYKVLRHGENARPAEIAATESDDLIPLKNHRGVLCVVETDTRLGQSCSVHYF